MSRITAGTMTVAVFAVLFGLVGAYSVRRYMHQPSVPTPLPAAVAKQDLSVPLASNELPAGKKLTIGDIMIVRMSPEKVKESGLPVDYMTNPQQIIGRTLRESRKKGDPFLTTLLYPEGMGPSLTERLKAGYRVVTVPIGDVNSVAGFAGPGTYVDLMFRTPATADNPETTMTLLSGVEVLAVGEKASGSRGGSGQGYMVALAVTPRQAAALKVVEGRGEMSLSIRGSSDVATVEDTNPLTLDGLLGLPKKQAPFQAEIYRGGSRQSLSFEQEKVVQERFGGLPVSMSGQRGTSEKNSDETTGE